MRKHAIIFLFLLFYAVIAPAQFRTVSIQAENQQPFYITVAKKTYISDNKGHLIITTLKSGKNDLLLGFIKGNNKEISLNCEVESRGNTEFLLRKNDKEGFYLEESKVDKAEKKEETTAKETTVKKDNFSNILSDVVDDSLISNGEPIKEKSAPAEVVPPPAAPQIKKAETAVMAAKQEPVIAETTPRPRYRISRDTVASDANPAKNTNDLPEIIITNVEEDLRKQFGTDSTEAEKEYASKKVAGNPFFFRREDTAASKPQSEVSLRMAELSMTQAEVLQDKAALRRDTADTPPAAPEVKPPCIDKADDKDSEKLRRKMYSAGSDIKMIEIARKAFREKCFNTQQIKELSTLFSSDDGRYRFFDAAYSFLVDSENFLSLESQLIDKYYKTRFRAIMK